VTGALQPDERPGAEEGLPEGLAAFRAACPILERVVYLASCSQAPLSAPVHEALERWTASWASLGMHWNAWVEEVEAARSAFAGLIGAAPEDVAVGTSVSQLVSSLASALVSLPDGWDGRRRIVASTLEFPGVGQAWEATSRYGWGVERLQHEIQDAPTADEFVNMVDDSTAVVSMPHVVYANGALVDPVPVVRAARQAGALVVLDAYQSVGAMPVDVRALGVDVLVAGTLKYLMGTAGIAFLYVRPEVRDRLEPTVTGWFGRANPFAFDPTTLDYPASAARFDLGTPPIVNAYAARAGIQLVVGADPSAIGQRIERLSRVAFDTADREGLRVLGPQSGTPKGATTCVDCGSTERAVAAEAALRDRGVVGSARGRGMRLAPHGFTLEAEVEHALAETAAVLRELGG
jgi:selenocysteine lyase/cysteine desulfurase